MDYAYDTLDLHQNLADLRSESLKIIALFGGAIMYIYSILLLWPLTGDMIPAGIWLCGVLLAAGVVASYLLRPHYLSIAAHVLVWSVFVSVLGAVLSLQSLNLAYLFALPVILASILLGQTTVFVIAFLACFSTLYIGLQYLGLAWYSAGILLPVATITLIALVSWLSARSLYIALTWVWSAYQQARQNEQIAREGQAELRRALKALDEAAYRLERTNYMLALARDQAEEARRLKQQFAQAISHELRTPLNLIVGFTELMVQSPEYYGDQLSSTYMRDLSIVHRNASHLQTLVNDVLDLARIEAAQMSLLPEEVDVTILVREVIDTARGLVEARDLFLHVEVEPDLPALWVDPTRIRQVLFNLLNNAARYTLQGGVTLRAWHQADKVFFAVEDTGVGIAAGDLPHIFEEFQQLDSVRQRRDGGVGLGLAISREFVELHGGTMWVESQVSEGSTFYFTLPVRKLDFPEAVAGYPGDVTSSTYSATQDKKPVLLAISPSPSGTALLARYLRGYQIVAVRNFEQAENAARQLIPQAVIVDTACDGFDSAHVNVLAKTWKLPQVPFLGCPLPGEESLWERLAVDGYLIKPVSRQELWDVLRRFGKEIDKILIVDDDHDFVRLISRMLDDPLRKYQVVCAYSGHQALEMISYQQPDLVLLDLMLPDIGGIEVIEQVRSNSAMGNLPIVVVSAQDEVDGLEALKGMVFATKAEGLMPGEIAQWIQQILNATVGQRRPSQ
jgi:signal transduction histidine kinase/DNA-binding response OmpR family regulator